MCQTFWTFDHPKQKGISQKRFSGSVLARADGLAFWGASHLESCLWGTLRILPHLRDLILWLAPMFIPKFLKKSATIRKFGWVVLQCGFRAMNTVLWHGCIIHTVSMGPLPEAHATSISQQHVPVMLIDSVVHSIPKHPLRHLKSVPCPITQGGVLLWNMLMCGVDDVCSHLVTWKRKGMCQCPPWCLQVPRLLVGDGVCVCWVCWLPPQCKCSLIGRCKRQFQCGMAPDERMGRCYIRECFLCSTRAVQYIGNCLNLSFGAVSTSDRASWWKVCLILLMASM